MSDAEKSRLVSRVTEALGEAAPEVMAKTDVPLRAPEIKKVANVVDGVLAEIEAAKVVNDNHFVRTAVRDALKKRRQGNDTSAVCRILGK